MSAYALRQPAIALVDDDSHSARLMTRMLAAHDGPQVEVYPGAADALDRLVRDLRHPAHAGNCLVLVDLKSTSRATGDFVADFRKRVPHALIAAMAPTLDRSLRVQLLEAGAAAVFERHADLNLYRREAAAIVAFWVRSQRLDAVGT